VSGVLIWRVGESMLDCSVRTQVMGVLNITPDSFSDGGVHFDPGVAVASGLQMVEDGADMLDVGGESTRPGSEPVPAAEEIDRVVPVIRALASKTDVPISVDTRKHEVASAALKAGASIVNDVSAGTFDEQMFGIVQRSGAGMVLMHMRGTPATMQGLTEYGDLVGEVRAFLADRIEAAVRAGIERERLAVDPGLGFAKNFKQSLLLMNRNDAFAELGRPVVVGPSRKSFIGQVTGTEVDQRMEGTVGAVAWLATHGAHIVRVHDVKEMVRAVRVVDAIRRAERESTPP
jgi:dihydropteroate synthase